MLKFLLIASKIICALTVCQIQLSRIFILIFEDIHDWIVTCTPFCLEKNNQRKSNEIETDTDLKSVVEHFN